MPKCSVDTCDKQAKYKCGGCGGSWCGEHIDYLDGKDFKFCLACGNRLEEVHG